MPDKQNIAVVFGGRTCEHDVSVITGHQVLENADRNKYELIPVYISRDGRWYTGSRLLDIGFLNAFDPREVTQVHIESTYDARGLYESNPRGGLFRSGRAALHTLDAVIPAMHGMNGEDGTLQGLLEIAGIPYAGPGVFGSAVGMDKIGMKRFFMGSGFPVLPFASLERGQWEQDAVAVIARIEKTLRYPMFVKPANLGSSIGITRAEDRQGLEEAIAVALGFDRRVLVEQGIDCTEVNCSALGIGCRAEASVCEQPVSWKEFLTFDQKYMRGGKGGKDGKETEGMRSLSRILPAPIGDELTDRIQKMTVDIFCAMDLKGVVRIDYMIDKADGALYVNEINTLPGSFAFYLWEPIGVSFPELIDRLIGQAFEAHREKRRNNYAYGTSLLSHYRAGGRGAKGGK
ncbi:MAG: D-alanine--D-alanine ligase [Clostridiales bacterium]|nr:D-alanine--D-alanine ligase [Clostridiales bacterium]